MTSIEQGRKLLALGLGPETADMAYVNWTSLHADRYVDVVGELGENNGVVPCWSAETLMALMAADSDKTVSLESNIEEDGTLYHELTFSDRWRGTEHDEVSSETENLADVCFRMMVWLLENGILKNQ